jgi:putative transposase
VHLVRHSLNFCGWQDRKNVARDLKRVYQATDDIEAETALTDFEAERGQKYPSIAPSMAAGLARGDPVLCLPASRTENHLYNECN